MPWFLLPAPLAHIVLVSFASEVFSSRGLEQIATLADALDAAGKGWVPTRPGLFVRYLNLDDLKQPCECPRSASIKVLTSKVRDHSRLSVLCVAGWISV